MDTVIGDLMDRAERVGAGLIICDDQDRIICANRKQAEIYNFIDFSSRPTYEDVLWRCLEHNKLADPFVYQDPHEWLHAAAQSRQISDYSQFITRHADGRALLVCYEKIKGSTHWWYQARIDITKELKSRFQSNDVLLGPASWSGTFAPLMKNDFVSINNVLEEMPSAAALIAEHGRIIEANRAFLDVLAVGDGMTNAGGKVALRNRAEQKDFSRLMADFFRPDSPAKLTPIRVSRSNSSEPYYMTLSSLLDRSVWNNNRIAILTVAAPVDYPTISPELLAEFFKISMAEAEVALSLAAGRTAAEIAKERSVGINTIYVQVKSILAKTGYKGQADIARRVAELSRIFGNLR